jgi:hypothetical protein
MKFPSAGSPMFANHCSRLIVVGTIIASFLVDAPRCFSDDISDLQDEVKSASGDVAKAEKEAADNRPNDATKGAEDKLDEAARKNGDTPGDAKTNKAKEDAQKAEDDARAAADKAAAASKDKDAAAAYRKALEKRREARNKIKTALAKLTSILQKRRRHTSDNADIEQAVKDAAKALKQAEQPIAMLLPERPTGDTLAMVAAAGKIKVDSAGTSETIGHIADLQFQNLTDQPVSFTVPPMILESGSGKNQHYACPKGESVALGPHEKKTVPMDGVCLVRNKPPVGKGVTGDLLINDGTPDTRQNPDSHLSKKDANKLLRLATSKYDAADKLLKDGSLKDIPYADPKKKKDIVVQWSTWTDPQISELTGAPPASKDDLKKVVYKQIEQQGPVTPDKKKKIDQGIDTIFEKVELTTAKAKDLEKPDPFAGVELTGEQGKGGTPAGPINVGDNTKRDETATKEPGGPATTTQTVKNPDGSVTKTITNKNLDGTTTTTTITTKTETHEDGSTTTIEKTTLPGGETREKTTDLDKGGKATRNSQVETDKHGRKTMEYREDLDLTDPNRKKIKGGTKKVTLYYPDKDGAPGGLKTERTENLGADGKVISGTEINIDPNGQTKTTPLP